MESKLVSFGKAVDALYEFDGHTGTDVINRLKNI